MSKQTNTTPADAEHPHYIRGASFAKTWVTCTAAPDAVLAARAVNEIPEDNRSGYADEGTLAHDSAYKIVMSKITAEDIKCPEMRQHVVDYLNETVKITRLGDSCSNYGTKMSEGGTGGHRYETAVPIFYKLDEVGTVDFMAVRLDGDNPGIDILDLKYGVGVKVHALENVQLLIYAISVLKVVREQVGSLEASFPVRLGIYQPRHRDFDGEVDWWETSVGNLDAWAETIEAAHEESCDPLLAQFRPSEGACQFCPFKPKCLVAAKSTFKGSPVNPFEHFESEDGEDTPDNPPAITGVPTVNHEMLTPEHVRWVVEHGPAMKKTIDDITKGEAERIRNGGEARGTKLVRGKPGNRAWADEEAADKMLAGYLNAKERHEPPKVISPTQAEKKLKAQEKAEGGKKLSKQLLVKMAMADHETIEASKHEPLVVRPQGKEVLVLETDERPALDFSPVETHFEDETTETKGQTDNTESGDVW